jgi:hypothetical protein
MTTAQLAFDLFGNIPNEAALAEEDAARDRAYDDLVAQLRVTVEDAKAHGLWLRASEKVSGERCKVTVLVCPACGEWEANDWSISNNHGIDTTHFERNDDGTWDTGQYGRSWCLALELTSSHVAGNYHLSDRQDRMLAGLRPEVQARFDREVAETRELIEQGWLHRTGKAADG